MQAVAFVTPMCAEKRPPVSDVSAEGAPKDTADAAKALTAELETSKMSLKASHLLVAPTPHTCH